MLFISKSFIILSIRNILFVLKEFQKWIQKENIFFLFIKLTHVFSTQFYLFFHALFTYLFRLPYNYSFFSTFSSPWTPNCPTYTSHSFKFMASVFIIIASKYIFLKFITYYYILHVTWLLHTYVNMCVCVSFLSVTCPVCIRLFVCICSGMTMWHWMNEWCALPQEGALLLLPTLLSCL